MSETLGGTLGLGPVHYQGGRDELSKKCRERDDEIDRQSAEISKLKSQLEEARAALKPFAHAHERFEAGLDDCTAEHFDASEICDGVSWGNLRQARSALEASNSNKEGGKS